MREAEKDGIGQEDHVVYTGAVLIPFCVGSVALPLSLCRPPHINTNNNNNNNNTSSAAAAEAQSSFTTNTNTSTSSTIIRGGTTSGSGGNKQKQQIKKKNDQNNKKQQRRKEDSNNNNNNHHHHNYSNSHEDGEVEDGHDYNEGISRCTHLRFSYIRDGSIAAQDLAYRRAWNNISRSSSPKTKEEEDENENEEKEEVPSASLLYSLIERVVFKLPNSFPEPRRELTHPPFFIVDDTWAEHMVEMEVHFKPFLGIDVFSVSHMVPLQRRADIPPQLLSSTFGQTKPPATVILAPANPVLSSMNSLIDNNNNNSGTEIIEGGFATERGGICIRLEDLEEIPIVAERRDAIRIFNPTLKVIRYLAAVRAMQSPQPIPPPSFIVLPGRKAFSMPVRVTEIDTHNTTEGGDEVRRIGEKRRRSHDDTNNDNNNNSDNNKNNNNDYSYYYYYNYNDNPYKSYNPSRGDWGLLPQWCFPFEAIMHAHEPRRQGGAIAAMRDVLTALEKEQEELREGIEQKINSATANAEELRGVIRRMRETCILLEKQNKH